MKYFSAFLILALQCISPQAVAGQDNFPDFHDYPAAVYSGITHVPRGYTYKNGSWRDGAGKVVSEPEINFGGKFHIGIHSCGAECRYFTMTDLSTGKDYKALDLFSTGDPPKKTEDGLNYVVDLITRPNSKLMVAKYKIFMRNQDACKMRFFVLTKNHNITPIGDFISNCRSVHN